MSLEMLLLSLGDSHGALPDRFPLFHGGQKRRATSHDSGWLVCRNADGDDSIMSRLVRLELSGNSTSLQTQCLRVLAKALPLYINAYGTEVMHSHMSTFPPWTLAALSIECSRQKSMNEDVAYILGHHDFVERLAIILPGKKKKTINLKRILHSSSSLLSRLELGNMHLETDMLYDMLNQTQLTHLSIHNCTCDKDALLHSVLCNNNNNNNNNNKSLQVLDVSDNEWVTGEWLLELLNIKHGASHLQYINVAGCNNISAYLLLRLNFDYRGQPLISTKRQRWK